MLDKDAEAEEHRPSYLSKNLHWFVPWNCNLKQREGEKVCYSVEDAGFLQVFSFAWLFPLVKKGIKKSLTVEDLGQPSKNIVADFALRKFKQLMKNGNGEEDSRKVSYLKLFFHFIFSKFIIILLFLTFAIITEFFSHALLLQKILEFLNSPDEPKTNGYIIVVIFALLVLIAQICRHVYLFLSVRIATCSKAVVLSLIYEKCLKLKSIEDKSVGELVNMCANDSTRIFESCMFAVNLIGLPAVVILYSVYLTYYFGVTVLAGFAFVFMFIPAQVALAKVFSKLREKVVLLTDKRVKMISEVLVAIKLIKMYAWERSFAKIIYGIRAKERIQLQRMAFVQGSLFSFSYILVILSPMAVFLTHILCGYEIDTPKAFTVISLFNLLLYYIITGPLAMRGVAEAVVSFKRLTKLMEMEEYVSYPTQCENEENLVEVINANLSWKKIMNSNKDNNIQVDNEAALKNKLANKKDEDSSEDLVVAFEPSKAEQDRLIKNSSVKVEGSFIPTLFGINLFVKKNSLVGICGGVGSGKSSIIQALLGEMNLVDGKIAVTDSVAYVSQQAWIMNATVRENILFGKNYEENFYKDVCTACALDDDLKVIPSGDLAEIGERGVNLSGGQKQRISLARAVYAEKELYLLDDPLSAVDSHVGKHIFEKCIKLALRKKTVILVTHQLQYLKDCDYIYYVKNGGFAEQGTYEELLGNNKDFSHDIKTFLHEHQNDRKERSQTAHNDFLSVKKCLQQSLSATSFHSFHSSHMELSGAESFLGLNTDATDDIEEEIEEKGKLIGTETYDKGSVSVATYAAFFKFAGGFVAIFLVCFFITFAVGLTLFAEYWIANWLKLKENVNSMNVTIGNGTRLIEESVDTDFYMRVYVITAAAIIVMTVTATFTTVFVLLRASTALHNEVFGKILRSPMEFFDTTPIGRIVNRLAKDVDEIDSQLPMMSESWFRNFMRVVGMFLLIGFVLPWFILGAVPLFLLLLLFNYFFRKLIRALKRIDNVTRSPIYSHLTTTVQGLLTIRSFQKIQHFTDQFHVYVNNNNLAVYLYNASIRCFGLYVDLFIVALNLLICIIAVMVKGSVAPSLVALCIAYTLRMIGMFQFTFRLQAEVEARFTSVERLNQYVKTLLPEGEFNSADALDDWPQSSSIEFENVSLRYRDGLPLVLKNLSFSIKSQEKIGIVGRTGAGKSSICVALYRLVNLEQGSIKIAGKSINDIGLTLLRSKLSIIPQDPTLFIGTIRYNLDPFEEHSDEEIWNALEKAHIKNMLSEMPEKLETMVMENGSNFSVGERQLICMGRALLRKSKILVLDEATASIDSKTDSKIQETIAEAFVDCTVLTVAHRLNTIMHCDKILVMEDGKAAEFGEPSELMNGNTKFKSMVLAMNARMKN